MSIRQLSRLTHRLGILLTLSGDVNDIPNDYKTTETQAGWQQFKAVTLLPRACH